MTHRLKNKKQNGGFANYPFDNQFNNYPIPSKVDAPILDTVGTNYVSSKDLYSCNLKTAPLVQNGGDCGCAGQPMQLGGKKKAVKKQKKQSGAGYGYSLGLENPVTNLPEVVRYQTDSSYIKGGKLINEYLANVSSNKQKGGSLASDSLMDYFLDFQHRCRSSEIY